MALVMLPGLTTLIEDISEEKKLPPNSDRKTTPTN